MTVPHAILAILADGPVHGYAIRSALRERLGLLWPINHGQVYATLARLASRGLVAVEAVPAAAPGLAVAAAKPDDRRRWRLLPAGDRRLASWIARPLPAASTAAGADARIAVALATGDPHLVAMVIEREIAACGALADTQRRARQREVRQRGESRAGGATSARARVALLHDAAAALLESDLAWLAELRALVLAGEAEDGGNSDAAGPAAGVRFASPAR